MWVPARLTAALLAAWFVAPGSLRAAAGWVGDIPSPNAGWPMGVLAAALDVRLEKVGVYVLNPDGRVPTHDDTRRALRRVGLAAVSAYGIAGVLAWY
jgi:adenosylcobinamide-phosphate synthase